MESSSSSAPASHLWFTKPFSLEPFSQLLDVKVPTSAAQMSSRPGHHKSRLCASSIIVLQCRFCYGNIIYKPSPLSSLYMGLFALKMTDMRLQNTSPGSKRQLSFGVKYNLQHMKNHRNVTANRYFCLKYGGNSLSFLSGAFSCFYGNLQNPHSLYQKQTNIWLCNDSVAITSSQATHTKCDPLHPLSSPCIKVNKNLESVSSENPMEQPEPFFMALLSVCFWEEKKKKTNCQFMPEAIKFCLPVYKKV